MVLRELYSSQIDDYYKGNQKYGKCVPYNQLHKLQNKFYFINLSNSHWELLFNCRHHEVDYFDSFGVFPADNEERLLKETGKKIILNAKTIQGLTKESCGFYCMYVADMLLRNRSMNDIMNDFSNNKEENEMVLQRYFHKIASRGGELDESGIEGDGVVNFLLNLEPIPVKLFMFRHGSEPVRNITICRIPVIGMIENFCNWFSNNELEKRKNELQYEHFYHLFLEVNQKYQWEKNEAVSIKVSNTIGKRAMQQDMLNVQLYNNQSPTLRKLLDNGFRQNPDNFYRYNPRTANCQIFCKNILTGAGLWSSIAEKFVIQDSLYLLTEEVGKKLGVVTDTAGLLNKILPFLPWVNTLYNLNTLYNIR